MAHRHSPDAEGGVQHLIARRCFRARRRIAAVMFVAVSLLGVEASAQSLRAREWFVDGDAATNGTGTSDSPFNSLRQVPEGLGQMIFVAGTFRESAAWGGDRRDNVVRPWPGRAEPVIRGDVLVPPDQWSARADGLYSTLVVSAPVSVVWNWDANIDGQGRHFGHLTAAASYSLCRSTPASWFYESTLGALLVNPPLGAAPPDVGDVYSWVRSGNGLALQAPERVTVDGLTFRLWSDPDSGNGYGLKVADGIFTTVSNCSFDDCGYHSAGFIGNRCVGNRFVACIGRGLNGRSNHFVFYSNGDDISGCAAVDCDAHLYGILDWTGAPVSSSNRCGGFFTHTGASALVRDLEFRGCRAFGYEDAIGNSFGSGMSSGQAADSRNPATYPIRIVECEAINCDFANIDGHAAFIRCRLDFRKASRTGGNSGACLLFNRTGTQVALESCEIITRLDGTYATRAIWVKNPGDRLYMLGVTFYDEYAQPASRSFIRVGEDAFAQAEQCVFSAVDPMYLTNGATTHTTDNFDFITCWYDGIAEGQYSASPLLNEKSEWIALIDGAGMYDVEPDFAGAPENLAPKVNGPLWRWRVPLQGVSRLGISGKEYDGRSGAHQFGWPVATITSPCPEPGLLKVQWSQGTPGGSLAVFYSRSLGLFTIPPPRPCAGLRLDLAAPTLIYLGLVTSDEYGNGQAEAIVGTDVCGGYLQLIDLPACSTSNPARIE